MCGLIVDTALMEYEKAILPSGLAPTSIACREHMIGIAGNLNMTYETAWSKGLLIVTSICNGTSDNV